MALSAPNTYPAGAGDNLLDIHLHRTPVEGDHIRTLLEKQNHNYKFRRSVFYRGNFAGAQGSVGAWTGYTSSSTSYAANPLLRIPATSKLWSPDDHDAVAKLVARALIVVTGTGTGTLRIKYGSGSSELNNTETAPFTEAWVDFGAPGNEAKNTVGQLMQVDLKVSAGTATIELLALYMYWEEQVTIGV